LKIKTITIGWIQPADMPVHGGETVG
jgi:hypothetical protein